VTVIGAAEGCMGGAAVYSDLARGKTFS